MSRSKKETEPVMLRLRALMTAEMPYARMIGTKFEWEDGEEARGWIAAGKARIVGDDPAEAEPEKPKTAARKATAKKARSPRKPRTKKSAAAKAPEVVTVAEQKEIAKVAKEEAAAEKATEEPNT